jgi:DNA replication protein DnaC
MDAYVPQKYLKASFDSFEGGKTVKELCQVAILDHESVMLCGKTGCGKTHLAVAMLRHFVSTTKNELGLRERTEDDIPRNGNDSRIMFLSVPELLLQIRGTFAKDSEQTEESVIERYSNMSLLILDDLGAEKTSEWVESTLYLIIDRRNRGQRWTIVTSNLSLEEIEQHLGARIASRLSDMKVVNIKLPDYRKKR